MSEQEDKKAIILNYEEEFTATLARRVIDKPRLSLWMILIPVFFVFYFFQLNKFSNGCKLFAQHYLVSKKRALNKAVEVVTTGQEPDVQSLTELSDMPDDARKKQVEVLTILIKHYTNLLKSTGEDYASLVRSAYGNLTNYLLFLNRLNQVEKEVNRTLKPHLSKSHEGINNVVNRIENQSENLRREIAESLFQ